MTILKATRYWVRGFNAFPQPMISMLIAYSPESWQEITLPTVGDSVFVYETSQCGEIISRNDFSYIVSLFDGNTVTLTSDEFEVCYDYPLPIWGTMWSFDDFGYLFGIDGTGYDFYEEHWIPLYLARGLQWHK